MSENTMFTATCILMLIGVAGCQPRPAAQGQSQKIVDSKTKRPPVFVTVAPVQKRPVRRTITAVGTLNAFEKIVVTPKAEGRVTAIHSDVGDRVSPGSLLLELDPTDAELAVQESERALEQELAKLGLESTPPADFDIEKLPSLVRARLVIENAALRLKRQKSLAEVDAAAKEVVDQVELELQIGDASLRQARLDARATLATVRQREAALAMARNLLAEKRVFAPRLTAWGADAVPLDLVVSARLVSTGEMVRAFPSTPVFELVADQILKLRAMVPERYLAKVVTGLTVNVRVDAYPDRVFVGKLARIHPTVDPQNRSFEVEAHVPNQKRLLRHGGFAKAEVVLADSEAALTVPTEAISSFAGINKVFRVRDGAAEEVLMELGAAESGWVEALGGLGPEDVVVTSGQSRLARGTIVSIRTPEARGAQ